MIKKYKEFIKESTTHFYPSTRSDDGIWDHVQDLKKKISPNIEKELTKMKKKLLSNLKPILDETVEERESIANWQWATTVTGLLRDGFLIKKTTLEQSLKCYIKAIELAEQIKMDKTYIKQIKESKKHLEKLLKEENEKSKRKNYDGLVFYPTFMDNFKN